MRWWIAVAALLATGACGRIGFDSAPRDAGPNGGVPDGAPVVIEDPTSATPLSYSHPIVTYGLGIEIFPNRPVTGTGADSYEAPTLPTGLAIDPVTGIVSGTPTAISAAASYAITAHFGGVSTVAVLQLEVRVGFRVDTLENTDDAVFGDGLCADALGACSLRAAATEASGAADKRVIVVPAGTYALANTLIAEGDLHLMGESSQDVTLVPAGGTTGIIVARATTRLAYASIACTQGVAVVINNGEASTFELYFGVIRGCSSGGNGGGIKGDDPSSNIIIYQSALRDNTAGNHAGAIFTQGNLHIERSTISNNRSLVADNGQTLWVEGVASIRSSTFSGNGTTIDGFGSHLGPGATIENSTFANNAGCVFLAGGTTNMRVTFSTFLANGRGLCTWNTGQFEIGHCAFQGNINGSCSGSDCDTKITSLGYNMADDAFVGAQAATTDLINQPPMLSAPIADNGGPTLTALPLAGPAVDGGDSSACPLLDQRGAVRMVDGDAEGTPGCDIGAVELVP